MSKSRFYGSFLLPAIYPKTEGSNVILAKNRYSLPPELPLSWQALVAAMTQTDTRPQEN